MHTFQHTEQRPNNYATIDATHARLWEAFAHEIAPWHFGRMPSSKPRLRIPSTPLRLYVHATPMRGPFFVEPAPLAGKEKLREIADEEILALAHFIHSAYLEWKQQ